MASLNYFDKDKQEWVAIPLGGTGGDSAVTVHDGSIPNPTEETPKGLEDSFAVYADGLHYFKEPGTLVAITRQQYQTDITLTGPVSSSAKIVKSEAGLPTPQNPSMIVLKRADGQWIKTTSGELDKPFGMPQMVDLFSLNGGGDPATTDLSGYYTKAEVDAAFPNYQYLSEITDSLNASASFYVSNASAQLDAKIQLKADKADTYTKTEVDTSLAGAGVAITQIQDNASNANGKIAALEAGKADKATTYTKPEVDEAIAASISGQLSPAQIEELISQVGPVDLTDYAKKEDASQNVIASAFVGQGFVFGTQAVGSNPGLVYTDTNEGYGSRLVLGTPAGKEYLVYASDLDPVKARVASLEGKAAPTIDAYTKVQADAKFLTLVDVDRYAYKAEVYTQKQCDDRFIRIDQAFSKIDFDNQMALTLYSRKQVDDKLAAISPIGASSINDPALADFKKSMLDEVKKLIAGGKTVPADIDWTVCPQVAGAGTIEARLLNGMLQLRGEVTITISATGTFTQVRKLPANFPKPLAEFNSLVYGIQTGSTYRRVFVRWATNGDIAICPDGAMTAATLTGATAYAY